MQVLDGPLVFGPGPIHAMDGDENVTVSEQIFFNFTGGRNNAFLYFN